MENKIKEYLKFELPVRKLAERGYVFQKLYAANYKTYRKEFGEYKSYTIWLYVKSKTIEVNDWYNGTEAIIKAWNDNPKVHNKEYCVFEMNRKTKEVRSRNQDKYIQDIIDKVPYNPEWKEIFLDPLFKEVVKEINILMNNVKPLMVLKKPKSAVAKKKK